MRSLRFELSGEFLGFIRTQEGKSRMLLRTTAGELHLKVPKEIRHQLSSVLRPGWQLTVAGCEQSDGFSGIVKRIVARVQVRSRETIALPETCVGCPIRVCAKKNCWKNGGKELWESLERELQAAGLSGWVELEAVSCLDNCKQAPNLVYRGVRQARCTSVNARQLVDRLACEAASGQPRE